MISVKNYRPTTPSLRMRTSIDRSTLWGGNPYKTLVKSISRSAGRNNQGSITVRHKSSGHKKLYRMVDFKRRKLDIPAVVERIEYDPYRSAPIALIKYEDGQYSYIIAPDGLRTGNSVVSSVNDLSIAVGNSMLLSMLPVGSVIHNIELKPGAGAALARSAGCSAQIIGKSIGYCTIRMQSNEIRNIKSECMASLGVVGNQHHKNIKVGKAGRSRWMGVRPTVRGVAMNPVDHPHGGGEGKTSGGRHPVSPSGRVVKGQITRKSKKTQKQILQKRRVK